MVNAYWALFYISKAVKLGLMDKVNATFIIVNTSGRFVRLNATLKKRRGRVYFEK